MRTLEIDTGSNPLNRRITNQYGTWFNIGTFLTTRAGLAPEDKPEVVKENFKRIRALMSNRGI